MEEAKRRTCYKRLINKQFVQVSGLCDRQFLSYLPKCFTHLWRAFYGDVILVYTVLVHQYGRRQQKHLALTFSIKAFLLTRELAYVRRNISSNTWNGYTAQNQNHFFNETAFLFWCYKLWKLGKLKLLYFRNEWCYGNGNLYKDLLFVYLQPCVHKNS